MNKKVFRFIPRVGAIVGLVGASLALFSCAPVKATAGEFFLQVSPSPFVVTVKPGEKTSHDLKIRNAGTQAEKLTIATRSFKINNTTGEVILDDTKNPAEVGDWVSFAEPNFMVKPGEWFTQKVTLAVPQDAGFSYAFAFVISRQDDTAVQEAGRELKASVAVFALINVDKPGATRTLELEKISTSSGIYEYPPAKIMVQLKNTGNSIVRPDGNIFIQRDPSDEVPISTLSVNPTEGYILPGSVRTLAVDWNSGYPAVSTDANGHVAEDWGLGNLGQLRMGYYTAKLVAVYNDGQRDVPVMGEVGFWIIPWKFLLGALVVLGLVGAGVWSIASKVVKGSRRRGHKGSVKFRR